MPQAIKYDFDYLSTKVDKLDTSYDQGYQQDRARNYSLSQIQDHPREEMNGVRGRLCYTELVITSPIRSSFWMSIRKKN